MSESRCAPRHAIDPRIYTEDQGYYSFWLCENGCFGNTMVWISAKCTAQDCPRCKTPMLPQTPRFV